MFDIQEELKKLPDQPGVYIMHDAADRIIYVGKAINLNRRVHSYFRSSTKKTPKIQKMVSLIDHFEYIITDSELEALVLENNLIKEHRPKYNTLLKDDKTYPYIKVTLGEEFPRVLFSRQMKKDKSRYFGPFTSAGAVKDTIELLTKLYRIRTCNRKIDAQMSADPEKAKPVERACLNYHMHRCDGPCIGKIDKETYHENVKKALAFLGGNYAPVLKELEENMQAAAEAMDFEEAIRWRDLLTSVRAVAQKQKITDFDGEDKDVIALASDEKAMVVQVFFIRSGKLIGREHYYMKNTEDETESQALGSFVKQYYAGTPYLPKTVLLSHDIEDIPLLEQWLSERRGSRMYFSVPQIGKKEKLVELAMKNAALVLSQDQERIKREQERTVGAMEEVAAWIGLTGLKRMEAFDISNTSGFESVGSMVVFEDGKPRRSDYRKFKIKTVEGPNDYASMKEVLTRRFTHGLEERAQRREKKLADAYGSFTKFPDLLLMDGGRGQVNICLEVLQELGLSIPVCGMVKDDHHRTRGLYFNNEEIPIDTRSEGFKLITRIQDEAHRFAIEYHRSLRGKASVKSILDEIPGIGPARRKALMRSFDSLDAIRMASEEELSAIPEITDACAKEIYAFFHGNAPETEGEAPDGAGADSSPEMQVGAGAET
ncbi:MAG: excinuclease ABC subunit UvrC [Lachnospiraceae bacterium]|nr:excinuclease ABC subunit UvrC [Lachnospiraceae bacterium]